jgi:hypothetical protein
MFSFFRACLIYFYSQFVLFSLFLLVSCEYFLFPVRVVLIH